MRSCHASLATQPAKQYFCSKKFQIIKIYLDEIKIFFFWCDTFSDSHNSTAEKAEHVAQETSYANSDRTSNDLV